MRSHAYRLSIETPKITPRSLGESVFSRGCPLEVLMRPVSKNPKLSRPSMVGFPAVTLDVYDPHRGLKVGKCTFFAFSPFLRRNGVEKFFFEPGPKNLLAFIFEYLSNAVSRVPIRCRYEYGVPQFCRFSPWVSFHPSFCSDGSGAIHVFIGGRSCRPPAAGVGRGRLPSS